MPSATVVTIFSPTHAPEYRDSQKAWTPRSTHVLLVRRVQHGNARVLERVVAVAGQCRGFGRRVVAAEHHDATAGTRTHGVGVLEDVAAAVQPRRLAVPGAGHAVDLRVRDGGPHLAAPHRCRRQLLVEPRAVDDPVLVEDVGHVVQGQVEAAQRRPRVARDHRGGRPPVALVEPVAEDEQARERIDAREDGFLPRPLGDSLDHLSSPSSCAPAEPHCSRGQHD